MNEGLRRLRKKIRKLRHENLELEEVIAELENAIIHFLDNRCPRTVDPSDDWHGDIATEEAAVEDLRRLVDTGMP
jgi:hypothetical protein